MPVTMPRFGLAAGVTSLALAAVAAIVWWAPFTPGIVFLVPAFLGALVAFVHGAWRLAATTICLCLCVAAVFPFIAIASGPWDAVLVLIPPAVAVGLGAWFIANYWRARPSDNVNELPAWLEKIRGRIGVTVGTVSLAAALAATFASWPLLFHMLSSPGSEAGFVFVAGGPGVDVAVNLVPLAFLGALTALACGAWRLAALTVFFTIVTYLTFGPSTLTNSPSFLFYFIEQFFGPLVGGASLTAYLIWSYRQFRRGA